MDGHDIDAACSAMELQADNDQQALDEFRELGVLASIHYADDTAGGEWRLARKYVTSALQVFDANPRLQPEMRRIAKQFLWASEFAKARPE